MRGPAVGPRARATWAGPVTAAIVAMLTPAVSAILLIHRNMWLPPFWWCSPPRKRSMVLPRHMSRHAYELTYVTVPGHGVLAMCWRCCGRSWGCKRPGCCTPVAPVSPFGPGPSGEVGRSSAGLIGWPAIRHAIRRPSGCYARMDPHIPITPVGIPIRRSGCFGIGSSAWPDTSSRLPIANNHADLRISRPWLGDAVTA